MSKTATTKVFSTTAWWQPLGGGELQPFKAGWQHEAASIEDLRKLFMRLIESTKDGSIIFLTREVAE